MQHTHRSCEFESPLNTSFGVAEAGPIRWAAAGVGLPMLHSALADWVGKHLDGVENKLRELGDRIREGLGIKELQPVPVPVRRPPQQGRRE